MKDNRETLIRKLLKELPELLGDYQHCALDADGNIDSRRKQNIREAKRAIARFENQMSKQSRVGQTSMQDDPDAVKGKATGVYAEDICQFVPQCYNQEARIQGWRSNPCLYEQR